MVVALIAAGASVADPHPTEAAAKPARVLLGRSVQGRPIEAVRIGDPASPRKALVVGSVHGDERQGIRVARDLVRSYPRLRGVDLWVVETVNPDGLARGTRTNARGVDLNRNFAHRWRRAGRRGSRYYSGPRAFSERESRIVRKLQQELKPAVSIWYHQPWGIVLDACPAHPIQYRYSELSKLPPSGCPGRGAGLRGTAAAWQMQVNPGSTAFVVELPAGRLSDRAAHRHARAAALVAADG